MQAKFYALLVTLRNSISPPTFDPHAVMGTIPGAIDTFDWVDGIRGLLPRVTRTRLPIGAPIVVSGWALEPGSAHPPTAVAVVLDAQTVHYAKIGFDRSDIAAKLDDDAPLDLGFSTVVGTEGLAPGSHELRAYALGADDAWYEAAHIAFGAYASMQPALDFAPGSTRITIDNVYDTPLNGPRGELNDIVPIGDVALVTGWAVDLDRQEAPAGICATDERGGRWNSLCDLSRPDVRGSIDAKSDMLGFEIPVPTGGFARGLHRFSVQAFDSAGRRIGRAKAVELQIACERAPFPRFARLTNDTVRVAATLKVLKSETALGPARVIDCEQRDVLSIMGWAVACDEDGPRETGQIFLELHTPGMLVPPIRFQAVAGFTLERAPRELPEPPCADAWFSYRLDTTNVEPGTYHLRVAVVRAGRCFYAWGELGTVRVREPADSAGTARRL